VGRQEGILLVIAKAAVFRFIEVTDAVAFVIAAFADQPAKDPLRILGICNAGIGIGAIDREDVVLGDRTPMPIGALQSFGARVSS
jgi:hypothetical protein